MDGMDSWDSRDSRESVVMDRMDDMDDMDGMDAMDNISDINISCHRGADGAGHSGGQGHDGSAAAGHSGEQGHAASRDGLERLAVGAAEGRRLSRAEGLWLVRQGDLALLGAMAHRARMAKCDPATVTYVVDRNINYTNVCACQCRFCAFFRPEGHPEAYTLTYDEIGAKVAELQAAGGSHILLQGGMHPGLGLAWHEGLLRHLKAGFGVHVHGYSAPEIRFLAELESLSVAAVLERLREAGLDSLPGGGAEVLSDPVRRRVSPRKGTVDDWLSVHRAAHQMGMATTATMMFGHGDTWDDRMEHLERIRTLQDETGGFTAFISWTFQPGATAIGRERDDARAGGSDDGDGGRLPGAHTYLRTVALSRLYLDNIRNFQASWVTQGAEIGQMTLRFGCNDFGGVMMEENVVRSAGCAFQMSEDRIRGLIREAGFAPRRRGYVY